MFSEPKHHVYLFHSFVSEMKKINLFDVMLPSSTFLYYFCIKIITTTTNMKKNLKKSTLCVHGGWEPKNGESRQLPIIQSTTFKYDNSEEMAMLFDLKKEG